MKITNKRIRQIIKEELTKILVEIKSPAISKIESLILADITQANILINDFKNSGTLDTAEQEYLQNLSDFINTFYRFLTLKRKMMEMIMEMGGLWDALRTDKGRKISAEKQTVEITLEELEHKLSNKITSKIKEKISDTFREPLVPAPQKNNFYNYIKK